MDHESKWETTTLLERAIKGGYLKNFPPEIVTKFTLKDLMQRDAENHTRLLFVAIHKDCLKDLGIKIVIQLTPKMILELGSSVYLKYVSHLQTEMIKQELINPSSLAMTNQQLQSLEKTLTDIIQIENQTDLRDLCTEDKLTLDKLSEEIELITHEIGGRELANIHVDYSSDHDHFKENWFDVNSDDSWS